MNDNHHPPVTGPGFTAADWRTVAQHLGANAAEAQADPLLRNTAANLWHLSSMAYAYAGCIALSAQAEVRAERCAAAPQAPKPVTIRLGDEGPRAIPVHQRATNVVQLRPAMWPTEICPVRAEPVREG